MLAIVSIVETKNIWIKHILMQDVAYYSYKNINIRHTCHPEMSGAKIKKYIRNQTYMSFRRSYRIKALQQKFFHFQTNCSIYLCTKWDLIKSLNKQLFNENYFVCVYQVNTGMFSLHNASILMHIFFFYTD